MDILTLLTAPTNLLLSTAIAAVVSAGVSYFFKRYETRDRLKAEYEYEQKKRLKELIGRYHGRLLQASANLSARLWNLYQNESQGWLNMGGDYKDAGYYFSSTVYRFLHVFTLLRGFETEAIFLDQRIANKENFVFLHYTAALRWTITDVGLFRGLEYDAFYPTDHFFSDALRQCCDSCWIDADFLSMEALAERIQEDRSLDDILRFFDGLRKDEDRLRWDRVVALHLLLAAFINAFGYETQSTTRGELEQIAVQAQHPEILNNLSAGLPSLGLGKEPSAAVVAKVIGKPD